MTTESLLPLLQTYYAQAFPDRVHPQIDRLTCLNNGWESDVYRFRVEWGETPVRQSEDLILRIYPGADAVEKSAREFRALSLLRKMGYPVPRVDHHEPSTSPFGHPFLIMEAVPGRSMWQPMFHALPWDQRRRLRQFCALFARLHALDWRPYVPHPEAFEPGGDYSVTERELSLWRPVFEAIPIAGFQSNLQWLTAHQRDVPSSRASLIHWDFHPNNILLQKGGKAVVIDWTSLDISDYRFDLAWTIMLITSFEGDRWRKTILREYERQAGHRVEDMEFFDACAGVRRLYSVAVSLAYGADKLGMRPGAEEIMRGQAHALGRIYHHLIAITGQAIPEIEQFLTASGA
jgi:aminoglycoside phosphotransferase (APT) family kinase protein